MRSTRHTGGGEVQFYNRFFEYAKVVTEVVVTDEGVYLKNEVPDAYGGARLELKVVNAVFMVNSRAELQVFEFEMGPVMDKDKKTGGPVKRDGIDIREATGDSTVVVQQKLELNENLDTTRKVLGEATLAALRAEISATSGQVPS